MPPAAQLLDRHPVLRRLSGQVIWRLLEEEGLPEARIALALESFEAAKAAHVELLRRSADPAERAARPWVLLRLAPGGPACAACAALRHALLPADRPDLAQIIPPYGLGCGLAASLAADADLAGLDPAPALLDPGRLPATALFCACRGLDRAACGP
jgi:hypothetical protein